MKPGDRITALNGTPVWTFADLQYHYDKVPRSAKQIQITVERDGKTGRTPDHAAGSLVVDRYPVPAIDCRSPGVLRVAAADAMLRSRNTSFRWMDSRAKSDMWMRLPR